MNKLVQVLKLKGLSEKYAITAELVSKGLSNAEVGNQLFISERQVKARLHRIYKIMGLKSRAQLIVWCLPYMPFGDQYIDTTVI